MVCIHDRNIRARSGFRFKQTLLENYALEQLEVKPRFFSDKAGEIDFVLQLGADILPLEILGEEDRYAPSFKRFIAEHRPSKAVGFSRRGYRTDGPIINVPLYLASKLRSLL